MLIFANNSGAVTFTDFYEKREITERELRRKQRKSREKTREKQGNVAHLLADYQPPNQTNKTPIKKGKQRNNKERTMLRYAKVLNLTKLNI
jgi:Icc-related predicted phosphoesterase